MNGLAVFRLGFLSSFIPLYSLHSFYKWPLPNWRYSATNSLNILFNFSMVGRWIVEWLSPALCHWFGKGVGMMWRIGTSKIKQIFVFVIPMTYIIQILDTHSSIYLNRYLFFQMEYGRLRVLQKRLCFPKLWIFFSSCPVIFQTSIACLSACSQLLEVVCTNSKDTKFLRTW